ncbi:MAG: hypothetical protein L0I76_28560 [Pseudonocardia sp.]|nr:hypothetical protein [Pseudonocardia sp.]
MTAAAAPVVAFNRFPTVVTEPGGASWREARTVITCPDGDQPARLMVWLRPGEPAVDEALHLDVSTIGRPRTVWQLVTDSGTYQVQAGSGCGCGSRLKRYEPFTPMRMGRLP